MRILIPLTLLLLATTAEAKEPKFAFVDMQRAMREVDEGKTAKSRLEKMKKERQDKLDKRQEELRAMQKDFEAQQEFMKEDVKSAKRDEFRQKLGELQQTYMALQQELAKEEAKLSQKILGRMSKILAKIGKAEGFTMIFEKGDGGLLWAEQHLDLTNEVIRRYNAGEGK